MKPSSRGIRTNGFLKRGTRGWLRVALGYLFVFAQSLGPPGVWLEPAQAATSATIGVTFSVNTSAGGAPADINDLVAASGGSGPGSLTLTWTEPGANGSSGTASQYLIRYSTITNINNDSDFNNATPYTARTIVPGPGGSARTEVIAGLCPKFTYYWAIKAQNGQGPTGSWTHDSSHNPNNFANPLNGVPPTVTNFAALAGDKVVTLSWTATNLCDFIRYRIHKDTQSPPSTVLVDITDQTTASLADTNVINGTTYYYTVETFNSFSSSTTAVVSAIPKSTTSAGVPAAPVVKSATILSVDNTNRVTQVQLSWNPVVNDANGAIISPPDYLISVSSSIPGAGQWSGTPTTKSTNYTVTLPNSTTRYVGVRAQTGNGQSQLGMIYAWPDQKWISPTTDATSWLELAKDANQALSTSGPAGYITYLTEKSDLTSGVVKSVQVNVLDPTTGKTVSDLTLPAGGGRIVVGYTVQGGQVVQGSPAITRGAPVIDVSKAAQQLALFWFNGVKWIKLGGDVDTSNSRVTFNTSRVGQFQIRQALRLGDLTLVQVYPRIITPNGDGKNDAAIFQFGEGSLTGVDIKGEVFDITGARVADLKPGPDPTKTLMWDGKDNDGRTVPSGIYIYQIELGGNRVNGTVVVAR